VSGPLRANALIGREAEVAAVRHAVTRAAAGSGGLLVITGEAGIGKSRLAAEAVRLAHGMGLAVLVGRAVPDGGVFRPVAEALYGHLREAAVVDSDELRPFRPALARLLPGGMATGAGDSAGAGVDPLVVLGEGVLRLLRQFAGAHGCVLLLEDQHWADRDTLGLLEYLAPALGGAAILVVATSRSDEYQPEALRRLLSAPGVTRLALDRLPAAEVSRLAVATAGGAVLPPALVRFLVEAAEGLPFLVEELLTDLVRSGSVAPAEGWSVRGELAVTVPKTVADVVRRRTDGFAPDHRRILAAAAVVGRAVDWSLLAPVTGLPEAEVVAGLRAAVSAYLLDADPLAWRHALIRDAVLADLLPPEHAALARRAAEVLADRDPHLAGPDAALVAELYARGGRPDRAAEALVRLARRAVAGGALRSADAVLARAADLGAEVETERVRVLALAGRGADALAVGDAALATATGEVRVALCLALARAAITATRWELAREYLDRADRLGDPRIDALAADAAYGAGRVAEAAALAATAVDAAERAGRFPVACEALEVVGRCARMTDPAAASAAFARAAGLAEAHGLVPWRIRALIGLATVQLLSTEESPYLGEARGLALDAGMLAEVAALDLLLADTRALADGPTTTLPVAVRAADLAGTLRLFPMRAMALVGVGFADAASGRAEELAAVLAEARGLTDAADVHAAAAGMEAVAAVLDRDLPAARDLLDGSVATVRRHGSAAPIHTWGLWVVVRAVLGDRDDAARAELRESGYLARTVNRGGLCYAEAVAAGRSGRGGEATAYLAEGDALLEHVPWWRRLVRLLVLEAALRDGWGDPVAELRAELAALEEAGSAAGADVARLARTCRDLLRRAGAPVPRRGRGDSTVPAPLRAAGVTSREMDVLTLVAQGLTNAQIAERLFLSRRTVETHVANLLGKTGAGTRGDLAAFTKAAGS
jgi:DNA-binding CsgD family transcriptional regulator